LGSAIGIEATKRGFNITPVRFDQFLKIRQPLLGSGNLAGNQTPQLENLASSKGCIFIHAAGRAHQMGNISESEMYVGNTDFPAFMAQEARRREADCFVLISSAKVMGDCSQQPFVESDDPKPKDVYARSKLAGEHKVTEALAGSRTRLIVLRPPLIYGPNVGANFAQMMSLSRSRLPLPLANATAKRAMVYRANVVAAVLHLIQSTHLSGTFFVRDEKMLSTTQWLNLLNQLNKHSSLSNRQLNLWAHEKSLRQFALPLPLLRGLMSLAGKPHWYERTCEPFEIDDSQLRATGFAPPFSVEQGALATLSSLRTTS
jgi:nucleoside-diphosphate-sugar epimerase